MLTIEGLVAALQLEPTGQDTYRAPNAESGHGVIFGGQLLAQSIVAGLAGHDGKRVKTVHTIFARGGSPDAPVEIAVDRMHAGRAFASSTVTISQGERLCTRSLVLLTADEPDFIRHADPAPPTPVPDGDAAVDGEGAWQLSIAGDVDIDDPEAVGPAELDVWTRFAGAPDDPAVDQALLAFATDGFLIATAMRPHAGVGQSQAHVTVSTGVISHTLTFHEPAPAGDWLLLSHHSPYAGRGRSYGRADVFRADGAIVASYVQDAMIRPLDRGRSGSAL
ncbi:MAG TPA: acyl-CoA thioesterase domain-containing protein [Acidimicrobiales bacterium]|nr:acyl-CoA thioesterase domain-containing protein [Acidimicrobiales bacterium]